MTEIIVSCQNLIHPENQQLFPYCQVSLRNNQHIWKLLFITEVCQKTDSPFWNITHIRTRPCNELKFQVQSKQTFLGSVHINYHQLVQSAQLVRELKNDLNQTHGLINIKALPVIGQNTLLKLNFSAQKLPRKDFFGKSDPYLIIYRTIDQDHFLAVKTTEVVKNTLNPFWQPIEISLQKLSNGDLHSPVKIQCYDWNRFGRSDYIGQLKLNIHQLTQPGTSFQFRNYLTHKSAGRLTIQDVKIEKWYTMEDYLNSGADLKLIVGIDFTFSNKQSSDPQSLHFVNSSVRNKYLQAIEAVLQVVSTQKFQSELTAFGFGGQPDWLGEISHCFPLNGDFQHPQISSFNQLLEIYQQALPRITLASPTHFQQLITKTNTLAQQALDQGELDYFLLVILTDGDIHDMPATISALVKSSSLPVSVLIVGIGDQDFRSMVALDADQGLLTDDQGQQSTRDLVQFVKYSDFSDSPLKFAKMALQELPLQFTTYMRNLIN